MDKAFIESYYHTYNSEDPDALSAFYHPDVVLSSAQGDLEGADAVLATYREIIELFMDRMRPTRIDIDGGTAVVEIVDTFVARQPVEDFMGMSLSVGDSFELRLRGTYELEDGMFRRITIEQL